MIHESGRVEHGERIKMRDAGALFTAGLTVVSRIHWRGKRTGSTIRLTTPNNPKPPENMNEENKAIEIQSDILNEGVKLVKANAKQQIATALFGGRVIEAGLAFRQVMTEACKAAGIERSRMEGMISNANPFLAPARLVARGEMSEKAFALLKHKECAAAFKRAGGVKDGGLEPEAWQAAFEENAAAAAAEKVTGKKPAADSATENGKPLTAAEVIAAAIDYRGSELTNNDIDMLKAKLERLRK